MPLRRSGIIMNIVLKHAYAQICLLRIKLYAFQVKTLNPTHPYQYTYNLLFSKPLICLFLVILQN